MEINQEQYFSTQNRQLAFALATAGCTFAPEATTNLYTLGFLRSKPQLRGMEVEEGVRHCVKYQVPGIVTYFFIRNEIFDRCIKAWDDTVALLEKASANKVDPTFSNLAEEDIMQLLCVHANNSSGMAKELPWLNAPFISDISATSKETEIPGKPAPRQHSEGKGRMWRLGASANVKKHLKIK